MNKLIIIIICLLSSALWASHITITSLPYTTTRSGTASEYDTLFLDGTKLSSATNGIIIQHNYIVLNLGTDTLAFGADCGNAYNGITFYNGVHDIIIYKGWIIYSPDSIHWDAAYVDNASLSYTYPPANNNNECLEVTGGYNVLLDSCNMIVGGWNGQIINWISAAGYYWPYQWEIRGGNYWNNCTGFYDRCGGTAVSFNLWSYDTTSSYTVKIHDIVMHNSPHMAMRIYRKAQVYACSLNLDVQNVFFTSPSGSVCKGLGNAFAIGLQYARPGATIHDNKITASRNHNGGRGIEVSGMGGGTTDSMITVYNNYVVSHQGNDYPEEYFFSGGSAFKWRNPVEYVHVYNNTFITYTKGECCLTQDCRDADTIKWADGRSASFYNSIGSLSEYSDSTPYAPANSIFENNNIICLALDNLAEAYGMSFETIGAGDSTVKTSDWSYNKIQSNSEGIRFGEFNGSGSNVILVGDTIVGLDSSYRTGDFYSVYFFSSNCTSNVMRDFVFQGLAEDKSVGYNSGVSNCDVAFERTLQVLVVDSLNYPYQGATIRITNDYGQTVGYDTSDANGLTGIMCRYHWDAASGDSIGYNPFDIFASYGLDSASSLNFILSDSIFTDTIQLIHTTGEIETLLTVTITATDTSYNYVTIRDTIVTQYCDDLDSIFYMFSSNSGLAWDTTVVLNPTNPQSHQFSSLNPSTQYQFKVKIFGCGTKYDESNTLAITTEASTPSTTKKYVMIKK